MDLQEEIDECENIYELDKYLHENRIRIQNSVDRLKTLFKNNDLDGACVETAHLKYWYNIEKLLSNKL
jgi:hypothetical protein